MANTREKAAAEIEASVSFLAGIEMPSTKHMEQGEREDAIEQMLRDLWMLAKNDGCIAAAWAFEFATCLHKSNVAAVQPVTGRRG